MSGVVRCSLAVLGYALAVAALVPGVLVVVLQGYVRHVGGLLWLVVPLSLAASAAMLGATLQLRRA